MRNFLIDTDTASDDAVAIMMALAEPSVKVLGLTTVAGNVDVKQATRNALLTAEICGSDVPVFAGADKPLTRPHEHAHWFHGKDGLGDREYPAPKRKAEREHAVDAIVRLAQAEPGLTLITLGPLTNVALALEREPELAERIGRCVVMGGAPCCEGNVTPAAEYNIWVDPEAARAVFRSKLKIEMIGWHVSRGPSVLRDDEIAAIEAIGTKKAKFAVESNQRRPRGLSRPDWRGRPLARRPDRDGGGARPVDRPFVVAPPGGDRMRQRAHPRHDRRRPPQRQRRREQRARSGRPPPARAKAPISCGRSTRAGSRLC